MKRQKHAAKKESFWHDVLQRCCNFFKKEFKIFISVFVFNLQVNIFVAMDYVEREGI